MPAGLVLGIAIGARHDDWVTVTQTRWGSGNTEVQGYTDLVNATRHDARHQLELDVVRHGADGVVLQEMDVRVGEHECPVQEGRRDHVLEATIIGTAIARFAAAAARRPRWRSCHWTRSGDRPRGSGSARESTTWCTGSRSI